MSADGTRSKTSAPARDLNALLGSRICHDLINPLGAISNGVELLSMSGISAAPELALIAESVEHANARIRFYRVAFGAAREGHTMPMGEVRQILEDVSRGGRLHYHWKVDGALPRLKVKLAFLVLLCCESAMPFGGEVTILATPNGWEIRASADRIKIEPDLWSLLEAPMADVEIVPNRVHFALIDEAARQAGVRLQTDLRETGIRVRF